MTEHYSDFDKLGAYEYFVNKEKRTVAVKFYPKEKSWGMLYEDTAKHRGALYQISGVITNCDFPEVLTGKAKCLPSDDFDIEAGMEIAKNRALKKFFDAKTKQAEGFIKILKQATADFETHKTNLEYESKCCTDRIECLSAGLPF